MKRYPAHGGDSGVVAYEEVDGGIAVQFQGGRIYLYTEAGIGTAHFAQLRLAASRGSGLATYISRHVHDRYEAVYDTARAWRSARA